MSDNNFGTEAECLFVWLFQDTVSFLSRENEFLRAHVSPEVLSNLPGPRGLPSSDTTSSSVGTLQTQTTSSGQSHS